MKNRDGKSVNGIQKLRLGTATDACDFFTGGAYTPSYKNAQVLDAFLADKPYSPYEYLYFYVYVYTRKIPVRGIRTPLLKRWNHVVSSAVREAFLSWKQTRPAEVRYHVKYQMQDILDRLRVFESSQVVLMNKTLSANGAVRIECALKLYGTEGLFRDSMFEVLNEFGEGAWRLLRTNPEYLDHLPLLLEEIEGEADVLRTLRR